MKAGATHLWGTLSPTLCPRPLAMTSVHNAPKASHVIFTSVYYQGSPVNLLNS